MDDCLGSLQLRSFVLAIGGCSNLKEVTHTNAPITMLQCQAIELYLKAFLRLKEGKVEGAGYLRRRYKAIAKDARKKGLPLCDHDPEGR